MIDFIDIYNKLNFITHKPLRIQYSNIIYKQQKVNNINLDNIIARLKLNEPIEYIFNSAEFYGRNFYVDKNTLIPRIETEEIINKTLEIFIDKKIKINTIIDIGTGSGCIIITIAKELENLKITKNIKFIGIDISKNALKIAKLNSKRLGLTKKIFFLKKNFKKFNFNRYKNILLCANLPYLPKSRILPSSVALYEPHKALFGTGCTGDGLIKKLKKIYFKNDNIKVLITEEDSGKIFTFIK